MVLAPSFSRPSIKRSTTPQLSHFASTSTVHENIIPNTVSLPYDTSPSYLFRCSPNPAFLHFFPPRHLHKFFSPVQSLQPGPERTDPDNNPSSGSPILRDIEKRETRCLIFFFSPSLYLDLHKYWHNVYERSQWRCQQTNKQKSRKKEQKMSVHAKQRNHSYFPQTKTLKKKKQEPEGNLSKKTHTQRNREKESACIGNTGQSCK